MDREDRYDDLIIKYASVYKRDPKQVKRQIRTESAFNPNAMNPGSKAKGLLQFMDGTWSEWCDGTPGVQERTQPRPSAFDPEANIRAGCAYMAALEKQFGTLEEALAAYNWGPGNVRKAQRKATEQNTDWKTLLPAETKNYLIKCLGYKAENINDR